LRHPRRYVAIVQENKRELHKVSAYRHGDSLDDPSPVPIADDLRREPFTRPCVAHTSQTGEDIVVPVQSIIGRVSATIALLFSVLAIAGCGGAVPAPKAFVAYHSADGRFSCDYPKGWEVEKGAGKPDAPYSYAKFTMGNAEIRVDADFAGSLFGDMAKAAGAMSGDPEAPAARVHPLGERHMKEEFSNYQEKEAKAFKSKGLGEGRRSIFTADQTLGGKTYGYRATLLSGDRRITVICTCPAGNWKALKPAFEKVIDSLRLSG
jgi:hypothetical protein